MATSFLSTASNCCAAPLNPSYTSSEFDFYLEDLKPKALIVKEDSNSPVIEVAIKRKIKIFNLLVNNKDPSGKFSLESKKENISHTINQNDNIIPEDIALILHTSGQPQTKNGSPYSFKIFVLLQKYCSNFKFR